MLNEASLEIKKREQLVFINFFCFEALNSPQVFILVEDFYKEHNLGVSNAPSYLAGYVPSPLLMTVCGGLKLYFVLK